MNAEKSRTGKWLERVMQCYSGVIVALIGSGCLLMALGFVVTMVKFLLWIWRR